MKRFIFLCATLKLAALLLSGCGPSPEKALKKLHSPSTDKDVTASPRYNFSSFAGTVCKTKVKVAIADVKRYTGAHDAELLAPIHFDQTHPKYDPLPATQIIAVLPPGTRLRITRLMQDQGAWGGVLAEAVLEDGTNAQKAFYLDPYLLAGNAWSRGPASTNWDVNPDMLEKVEK